MFDVFYSGVKPNLFAHEREARDRDHARELSRTRYFWWTNYLTDYSSFDFLYEPPPWQADQSHVWPSQHQDNGGTWLIPKLGGTAVNREHAQLPRSGAAPILGVDHGNGFTVLRPPVRTRYISDYLGTLRRLLSKVPHEYVWVVSSVCDYSTFDFTWHPSEWQDRMLHVFASDEQAFGDTFYVHVPTFLERSRDIKLLEWFDTLHFVEGITVPRLPVPVVGHWHGSHVPAVWHHDFQDPVVQFTVDQSLPKPPAMNLWREATKTIIPLSTGASSVLVPREAKNHLNTQLYDYPYIDRSHRSCKKDIPCDVIFISNGEPMAEENWTNLLRVCPRAQRSDGVVGREAAYKAAAAMSETDWFYAVFAKTWVLDSFDFAFQPDRLQAAKHYIFHSRNALNGLEYGAMNINLYHRQLVLDTQPGLDFTLSALHTVVPVCASISRFNTDPWITWRSAFRETMKLQLEVDQGAGAEIQHRLRVWLTQAEGANADHCLAGARDGVEYYRSVNGDLSALQNSFDWAWCQDYYYAKYQQQPWLEPVQEVLC
jgi:hypothetical protein